MKGLDRYLTIPPQDTFTDFAEAVTENYTQEFFEEIEDYWMDSDLENKWMESLYYKEYTPLGAAEIIERAYKLFKIKDGRD